MYNTATVPARKKGAVVTKENITQNVFKWHNLVFEGVFIGQYIRQNNKNGRIELAKTIQGGLNSDIRLAE